MKTRLSIATLFALLGTTAYTTAQA